MDFLTWFIALGDQLLYRQITTWGMTKESERTEIENYMHVLFFSFAIRITFTFIFGNRKGQSRPHGQLLLHMAYYGVCVSRAELRPSRSMVGAQVSARRSSIEHHLIAIFLDLPTDIEEDMVDWQWLAGHLIMWPWHYTSVSSARFSQIR